jgi:hypothetical protein
MAWPSEEVTTSVMGLAAEERIAFAIDCTKRLLPFYERFVAETGWGDVDVLRRALEYARSWADTSAGRRGRRSSRHVSG